MTARAARPRPAALSQRCSSAGEVLSALIPVGRVFGETAVDHARNAAREAQRHRRERRWWLRRVCDENGRRRLVLEWEASTQRVVAYDSQRVEVGPSING